MNVLQSMEYVTAQGEKGRQRGMENAFRRDSMAALEGDPDAFMRQAAIDPAQAVQVQQAGDVNARRIRGAAKYMQQALESQNPAQVQGAWNAVRPYLSKVTGKGAPDAWDDNMRPAMEQLLAKTAYLDQAAAGNNVQSRFVAEDGRVMMVMRDGSVVDSGQKADRQMWFRDHPGMPPELVGKSGQVIPVGQQAPQAAPMQPQQVQTQFTGSDGVPVNIDPSLPPQVQAAIRANESQWAQAPAGATAAITGPQGQPSPSGYTPGAARPAMTPAQMAADRRAEEANLRAQEQLEFARRAADRADRAEDRASQPKISAAEQKEAAARRAKVPQLQNAIRGLDRIESALSALNMPGINTGPLDQYAVRQLPSGQELEAAVGGIQNSFLALTRVPGIGSQSDLEARIAALQYPSLDKAPEVNARTMQNLRAFARDLAQAYQVAVESDAASGAYNAQPEAAGPLQYAARPQTEADFNALPSGALYVDPDDGRTYRKP